MWRLNDVIVVSDIHLAAEHGKGLFQADREFADFLDWVVEENPGSTLILNGDVLDFLVVEKAEPIDKALSLSQATSRTRTIIDHHSEVFAALSRLTRSSHHRLVIMGGNHDAEIALAGVQEIIESKLGGSDAYPAVRWLVHGQAARIQVGSALMSIEHGDMYDDWNRIDHRSLRRAASLESRGLLAHHRYTPPPGSRLVVEYLTRIREKYPWVDLLKPEREAVIPILYEFLGVREKYKLILALRTWFSMLGRSMVRDVRESIRKSNIVRDSEEVESRRKRFYEWLESIGSGSRSSLLKVEDRDRLIDRLRKTSAEDGYFDIKTPDEAREEVAWLLEQDIDLIIHGHTHAAKAYRPSRRNLFVNAPDIATSYVAERSADYSGKEGLYINTGTWGRLLRLPDSRSTNEEWGTFIEGLYEGRDDGFLRATFAQVKKDDRVETASLMQWQDGRPEVLSAWCFDGKRRQWREEG